MDNFDRLHEDLKMVSNHLRYQTYVDLPRPKESKHFPYVFNMCSEGNPIGYGYSKEDNDGHHCGTACCIAGLLHVIKQGHPSHTACSWAFRTYSEGMREDLKDSIRQTMTELFYPLEDELNNHPNIDLDKFWATIKPTQAADVIDHYLETGVVDWEMFIEVKEI